MTNREIDALVAEKVMGWKKVYRHQYEQHFGNANLHFQYDWVWSHCGQGDGAQDCPRYSTSIADAWSVVEKFRKGFWFYVEQMETIYKVQIESDEHISTRKFYDAYAETAPMAICLAALKAVGIEIPQAL